MSEREELEEYIDRDNWCKRTRHEEKDWYLSWHNKHQRKVSIQEIRFIVEELVDIEEIVEKAHHLLNGEEKVWCEHIEHKDSSWRFVYVPAGSVLTNDWTICPICGKERPKC